MFLTLQARGNVMSEMAGEKTTGDGRDYFKVEGPRPTGLLVGERAWWTCRHSQTRFSHFSKETRGLDF